MKYDIYIYVLTRRYTLVAYHRYTGKGLHATYVCCLSPIYVDQLLIVCS